ncbi:Sybindin-like protein [Myriangium duriaei CBS 260.36]|uniref:Trafficking protein particle complex subunit n=1 Tax=Myriangium duriaei CBS 260.36 TaxID=1168546 RepID=A0A9P4MFZ3_9PEZI|nr:Sybindin-like protein [Myriangium duriaei CBS 260.36]
MSVVFALLIINKAGGLIYTRTVSSGLQKLSANDYLILAGTFHGIHAIARSLCPVPSSSLPAPSAAPAIFQSSSSSAATTTTSGQQQQQQQQQVPGGAGPSRRATATGIESLESSHFRLTVKQTATGTKFLLFTSPDTAQGAAEGTVRRCYEVYAQFVMGNPFYSLEMPIRIERFEREVGRVLGRGG